MICNNDPFGCKAPVADRDFHHDTKLCVTCAVRTAEQLRVGIGDLGRALAAYRTATSRSANPRPSEAEYLAALGEMSRAAPSHAIQLLPKKERPAHLPKPRADYAPADSALPAGDRQAA